MSKKTTSSPPPDGEPVPVETPAVETPAVETPPTPCGTAHLTTVPQIGMTVDYTVVDGQTPGARRAGIITATFHEPGWEAAKDKVCWKVNLTLFPNQHSLSLHEETHPFLAPYSLDAGDRNTWRYPSYEHLVPEPPPIEKPAES